jgi:putative SOS response-associated peptidase YedK
MHPPPLSNEQRPTLARASGSAEVGRFLSFPGIVTAMCGRFAMDQETNELIEEYVLQGNDFRDWAPQFSIAPTEVVPIIRERRDKDTGEVTRTVEPAVWDFHPAFMKDSKRPQFNARIETVASNGLWKGAFASSRCIVPMRGYYEWSEILLDGKKAKQPHFIHGQSPTLAAAGIYTARKVDDEWVVSTAIVTREARDASGDIHDRMPVFLVPDVYDEWLNPAKLDDEPAKAAMLGMLHDVSGDVASTITTYEVDRKVNNSRTIDERDPTLIQPV